MYVFLKLHKIISPHIMFLMFLKGPWILQTMMFVFMFLLMKKMQSVKFEIEKFNSKNNFDIWKVKMHDLLVQQGVVKVFLGKAKQLTSITDDDWDDMDARALSAICLCLADDILFILSWRRQQLIYGRSWKSCTWRNP
jgi:hypothetical protein